MATNDFFIGATLLQRDTGTNLRRPLTLLAQSGVGSAGGSPISTTTPTVFDLTNVTTAGMGWFLNLGTNDVEIGIYVTTVDPVSAFYPVLIAKPGIAMVIYMHADIKTATPLRHQTLSGTSVLQWQIWEA